MFALAVGKGAIGSHSDSSNHRPLYPLRLLVRIVSAFLGKWNSIACAMFMLSISARTRSRCRSKSNPMHLRSGRPKITSSMSWSVTRKSTLRRRKGPQGSRTLTRLTRSILDAVRGTDSGVFTAIDNLARLFNGVILFAAPFEFKASKTRLGSALTSEPLSSGAVSSHNYSKVIAYREFPVPTLGVAMRLTLTFFRFLYSFNSRRL